VGRKIGEESANIVEGGGGAHAAWVTHGGGGSQAGASVPKPDR
jgi:hypothetical protein